MGQIQIGSSRCFLKDHTNLWEKPEEFLNTNNQRVGRGLGGPWARVCLINLHIFAIAKEGRKREREMFNLKYNVKSYMFKSPDLFLSWPTSYTAFGIFFNHYVSLQGCTPLMRENSST
jgi:hypothetical protein